MSEPAILPWEPADGPFSESAMRRKLERLGYSVSRYVYPPGTVFSEHTHSTGKIDGVVSGSFRIVLEGTPLLLGPGDAVEIPEGAVHAAEVIGDEPVVSLDATRR